MSIIPAELLGTCGLMLVVLGCARSGKAETGPFAVGAWLTAAAFASRGALMNPALTLGARTSSRAALLHIAPQLLGALLALAIIMVAYPKPRPESVTDFMAVN